MTPSPRILIAAVALTLFAPVLAPIPVAAQDGNGEGPSLRLHITSESAGAEQDFEAFDADKLVLFDVNGDGLLEILTHNDNNRWYVMDPRTGKILHERRTFLPSNWDFREIAPPAVGDLDDNGRTDVVVANTMGVVTRYEFDPWNSTSERYAFEKLWQEQVSPEQIEPGFYEEHSMFKGTGPAFDGGPYLADADGDGNLEIFLISDNVHGIYTFNADGTLRWGNVKDNGNTNPTPADLDGDGDLEVVYVNDDGQVFALDASSGRELWTFHAQSKEVWPASIAKAPSVVDVDGDGDKEIFFGARVAIKNESDPDWYNKQHARFFLVDHNGNKIWDTSYPMGAPMYSNRAAFADCSGDGNSDFIFMDWNTIGHKPGEWQNTGPPHLYCVDARTGSLHWATELKGTYYGNKDPIVADADGDGGMNILVPERQNGNKEGLAWYDLSGRRQGWTATPEGWTIINDPVAGDVDGDGDLDVVTPLSRTLDKENYRDLSLGYREGALAIVDFGVPASIQWSGTWLFNHAIDRPYDEAAGTFTPPEPNTANVTIERNAPLTLNVTLTGLDVAGGVDARVGADGEWVALTREDNTTWTSDLETSEGDALTILVYDAEGRPVTFGTRIIGQNQGNGWAPGDPEGGATIPVPSVLPAILAATVFLLLKRANFPPNTHEREDPRSHGAANVRGRRLHGRCGRQDRR